MNEKLGESEDRDPQSGGQQLVNKNLAATGTLADVIGWEEASKVFAELKERRRVLYKRAVEYWGPKPGPFDSTHRFR